MLYCNAHEPQVREEKISHSRMAVNPSVLPCRQGLTIRVRAPCRRYDIVVNRCRNGRYARNGSVVKYFFLPYTAFNRTLSYVARDGATAAFRRQVPISRKSRAWMGLARKDCLPFGTRLLWMCSGSWR